MTQAPKQCPRLQVAQCLANRDVLVNRRLVISSLRATRNQVCTHAKVIENENSNCSACPRRAEAIRIAQACKLPVQANATDGRYTTITIHSSICEYSSFPIISDSGPLLYFLVEDEDVDFFGWRQ